MVEDLKHSMILISNIGPEPNRVTPICCHVHPMHLFFPNGKHKRSWLTTRFFSLGEALEDDGQESEEDESLSESDETDP